MRTIKFRGKHIETNKWHYGDLRQIESNCAIVENFHETRPVDPYTIGQFTGLLDKNGKEIYEGDIIHLDYPSWNYVIFWNNKTLSFEYYKIGSNQTYQLNAISSILQLRHYEVIGNIHDNPELIKY